MIKILIDTNIILDIGLKRKPFFIDSSDIIKRIDNNKIIGFVTATTITDIYYISRKVKGHDIAIEFIKNLIQIFDIIGVDKETIIKSLNSELKDFEDSIQETSAKLNGIEIIITRNIDDFKDSELEIYTPIDFIKYLNNK